MYAEMMKGERGVSLVRKGKTANAGRAETREERGRRYEEQQRCP